MSSSVLWICAPEQVPRHVDWQASWDLLGFGGISDPGRCLRGAPTGTVGYYGWAFLAVAMGCVLLYFCVVLMVVDGVWLWLPGVLRCSEVWRGGYYLHRELGRGHRGRVHWIPSTRYVVVVLPPGGQLVLPHGL